MSLFDRLRLILRLRSVADATEKEIRMNNWNWQLTARKALLSLVTHGATALIALLAVLPDSSVNAWLLAQGFPPTVVAIATPVAMMLIRGGANWWKHRLPADADAPQGPPPPPAV